MSGIGVVAEVCRYPVKSMAGESIGEGFVGYAGMMGDRVHAFLATEGDPAFPWLTAREQEDLVLYRPRYVSAHPNAVPEFLAESEKLAPGVNPMFPDTPDFAVEVLSPSGRALPVGSAELLAELQEKSQLALRLVYSQRSHYDCRPISLISHGTINGLAQELGRALDPRRFRANLYVRWNEGAAPYFENELVGARLRIGDRLELSILERDPRCKMITIDPDSAETDNSILRHVTRRHDGKAGVFAAVLREGRVRPGDPVVLVDHGGRQ